MRVEEHYLVKVRALNIRRETQDSEKEKDNSLTEYLRVKGKTIIQPQTSQFIEDAIDEVDGSILLACPKRR